MFVVVGYSSGCAWCDKAKQLLTQRGKSFTYLEVDNEGGLRNFLKALGKRTVPQIFDGTQYVGGFNELKEYLDDADDDAT